MPRVTNSSSIASYEYNAQTETLEVEFVKSQGAYTFYDVPQVVAEELERAESKGKYFYGFIRGRYRTEKRAAAAPVEGQP